MFRWLGVAGFELKTPGMTLLVDPFLTRPPAYKLLFGRTCPNGALLRQHLPQADAILISHSHYDHLLDAAEIARYTGARVYGSAHTCRIVEVCGLQSDQAQRVQAGEVLHLPASADLGLEGEMVVEVLAGEHAPVYIYGPGKLPEKLSYPLRLNDFVMDEDFGFLIWAGESSLLAWHNWHPAPAPHADVLLIGADIRLPDLPELLDQVQPRLLIPTHWDNFLRPLDKPLRPFFRPPSWKRPWLDRYDPWKLKRQVEWARPGVEVLVPRLLEKFTI